MKPKIGIALGGGGARGFAHIGVLQALEAAGIDCDVVSGTSIGALVGAIYASGNIDKLVVASTRIKLTDIPLLLSPAWSTAGMFSGKNALEMLNEFVSVELIEQLPKPFAAVSADLNNAEIVIASHGDLRTAIRASIAIPGVFTPVCQGPRLLVDGGTLDPVPVEAARRLGADVVIAVDLFGAYPLQDPLLYTAPSLLERFPAVTTALGYLRSLSSKIGRSGAAPALEPDEGAIPNIIEMVERTLAVSQQHLTRLRLREHPADVVIAPAVSEVGLLDFHRGSPIIEIGRRAAEQALPRVRDELERRCAISQTGTEHG